MSWTSPRSWSACEVVTAAIMNTHVRDNLLQTFPALVTSKGDSVWATAANAGTRVAVGTDGALITASSGCNAGVRWTAGDLSVNYSASTITANHKFRVNQSASTQGEIAMTGCGTDYDWRWLWDDANGNGLGAGSSLQLWHGLSRIMTWFGGDAASGQIQIGSGTASNSHSSAGLVIKGGGPEMLTCKGTSLKHGITARAETDTLFYISSTDPVNGGVYMEALSASTYTANIPTLDIYATSGKAADTTKSNAALGIAELYVSVKSGTGQGAAASTGDIFTISNSGSTRFIFQGGGDLYADSGLTASAFDSHDDVQLVRALEVERNPGTIIRDQFDSWLKYGRKDLEAADIAVFNDPAEGGDGSVFVNVMGLQRLHSGAIWQTHKYVRQLEDRISQLERLLIGPPKAAA